MEETICLPIIDELEERRRRMARIVGSRLCFNGIRKDFIKKTAVIIEAEEALREAKKTYVKEAFRNEELFRRAKEDIREAKEALREARESYISLFLEVDERLEKEAIERDRQANIRRQAEKNRKIEIEK